MNTRKKNKEQGFYKNLNDFYKNKRYTKPNNQNKGKNFKQFEKLLNFKIVDQLKPRTKSSTIRKIKFPISLNLMLALKERYNLGGRFQANTNFFNDFVVIRERFVNEVDYCSLKPGNIFFKISNPKKIRYYDKQMNLKETNYLPEFSCQFTKYNRVLA